MVWAHGSSVENLPGPKVSRPQGLASAVSTRLLPAVLEPVPPAGPAALPRLLQPQAQVESISCVKEAGEEFLQAPSLW